MAIQYSNELAQFICSVRLQACTDAKIRRTDAQRVKLIIMLNDALTSYGENPLRKNLRKPVLQAITGLPLLDPSDGECSQNMLSNRWHNILIEEMSNVESDLRAREIARLIESNPETAPWEIFPTEW